MKTTPEEIPGPIASIPKFEKGLRAVPTTVYFVNPHNE